MSTIGRLVGNSTWNGIAFIISAGLNLVSLPYVVHQIGLTEFGMAGLVLASITPAIVISNSFYQVSVREFAQSIGGGIERTVESILSTSILLATISICIILLIIISIYLLILTTMTASHDQQIRETALALIIAGGGWALRYLSETFQSLLAANQNFQDVAKINIVTSSASTLCIVVLLSLRPSAEMYLLCLLIGFSCGLLCAFLLARRRFPSHIGFPKWQEGRLWHFLKDGSWLALAQVGGLVSGQTERIALGALLGTQYVGLYNVAQRLEEALYIGILKLTEVLYPLFSAFGERNDEHQTDNMFRASWLLTILSTTLLGAVIPVAEPAIRLWTNAELASDAFHVLIFLTLAGILGCATNVFKYYLLGRGKAKQYAAISLATSIFVVVCSVTLLSTAGWSAAGISALVGMTAQFLIISAFISKSSTPDALSKIFHFVACPVLTGTGAALLLHEYAQSLPAPSHWWEGVVLYIQNAMGISCAILIVAVLSPHRKTFLGDLRSVAAHSSRTIKIALSKIKSS